MIPEYREYPASAALAPWVACYWTRAAFAFNEPYVQRVLPDGCADVIFDLQAAAFAVGTMTTTLLLREHTAPELLGVRFRPGRAYPFFRMPLSEVTDQRVDLLEMWGRDARAIAERIAIESTTERRIAVIEAALLHQSAEVRGDDPRVDAAVAWIVRSAGRVSIERVANEIGISRQHLSRRFLQHVGVTPKTFARVMRFESLVREARARGTHDWSALALDFGYFDQAHLIAEFRELAGITPVPFFQSSEIVSP